MLSVCVYRVLCVCVCVYRVLCVCVPCAVVVRWLCSRVLCCTVRDVCVCACVYVYCALCGSTWFRVSGLFRPFSGFLGAPSLGGCRVSGLSLVERLRAVRARSRAPGLRPSRARFGPFWAEKGPFLAFSGLLGCSGGCCRLVPRCGVVWAPAGRFGWFGLFFPFSVKTAVSEPLAQNSCFRVLVGFGGVSGLFGPWWRSVVLGWARLGVGLGLFRAFRPFRASFRPEPGIWAA